MFKKKTYGSLEKLPLSMVFSHLLPAYSIQTRNRHNLRVTSSVMMCLHQKTTNNRDVCENNTSERQL